jgi:uncharacterized protein
MPERAPPLLKPDARFLAVDDAPHVRADATVPLVGVITRGAQYVEGVLMGEAAVDGADGTEAVLGLAQRSRFRPLLRAILLNGVFVGGLNLVDPTVLHEATGLPVIALVRSEPRPTRVRAAFAAAFDDWRPRWRRVQALTPDRLPGVPLWATLEGITPRDAARFVRHLTVRGNLPEPLRLAHVIASGFIRGESRGRA